MTLHVAQRGPDTFLVEADGAAELQEWILTWSSYARRGGYQFEVQVAADTLSATAIRRRPAADSPVPNSASS